MKQLRRKMVSKRAKEGHASKLLTFSNFYCWDAVYPLIMTWDAVYLLIVTWDEVYLPIMTWDAVYLMIMTRDASTVSPSPTESSEIDTKFGVRRFAIFNWLLQRTLAPRPETTATFLFHERAHPRVCVHTWLYYFSSFTFCFGLHTYTAVWSIKGIFPRPTRTPNVQTFERYTVCVLYFVSNEPIIYGYYRKRHTIFENNAPMNNATITAIIIIVSSRYETQ